MLTVENHKVATAAKVVIDGSPLEIGQVCEIGKAKSHVVLSQDPAQLRRIEAATELVDRAVDEGWAIYGITTGFGGMSDVPVPCHLAAASQNNLLSFLATGAGQPIDRRHVRAAMALRANVLFRGYSGTRLEIIQRLVTFLNAEATPVVRELGSIGASGDLVPLSTIARAVTGHSDSVTVELGGRQLDGPAALAELGLEPLELLPKEGLAIVNGTSFSSAVAANCVAESRRLLALSICSQAMMLEALRVQSEPFADFVHQRKPHAGQVWIARAMKRLLAQNRANQNGKAKSSGKQGVQDRYSLRCLPQYMGPIVDGIARVADTVATEMNAVSDNPLVDAEGEQFYQSGNFLGQYVGIAMDDLRRFIGLLAKHLDVQIASLVSPPFSGELPGSLRGNDEVPYNMGLKGLQITGNSIMPMLTYLGNPLVEHFPTHAEQFNQNINGLSWGAAQMAWRSVELFRHYLAVALVFSVQALDLRAKQSFGHYDGRVLLGEELERVYSAVCQATETQPGAQQPFVFNDSERWLEKDLAALAAEIEGDGPLVESLVPLLEEFDQFQRDN